MYWDAGYWPIVTGIVYNDDPIVYTDVRATIVLTNSDGNVVGGGYTYIDLSRAMINGFSAYVDAWIQLKQLKFIRLATARKCDRL